MKKNIAISKIFENPTNPSLSSPLRLALVVVCFLAGASSRVALAQSYENNPTPLAPSQYFQGVIPDSNTQSADFAHGLRSCAGRMHDSDCRTPIIESVVQDLGSSDRLNQTLTGYSGQTMVTIRPMEKMILRGQKIVLDTQDETACRQVQEYIQGYKAQRSKNSENIMNICSQTSKDSSQRYRTITVMGEANEDHLIEFKHTFLTSAENNILTDTRNAVLLQSAIFGLLWISPESFSKWNKKEIKERGLFKNRQDHISHRPVRDKDSNAVNFGAHPYAGALYYNIARHEGYSPLESFGYSVMMSTFFWEYGIEAFAERPSIQDLIATPVLGSIIGEVFFQLASKIRENNKEVLGSKKLGKLLLILLTPAEVLFEEINSFLGKKAIQEARTFFVFGTRSNPMMPAMRSNYYGVELQFGF